MVYSADCLFCILRRGLYRCAFYALRRLVYPISHYITPCNRAFQPFFIDDHRASAHTRSGEYKRQCGVCLGPLRALGQDFRSRAGGVAPPCRTLIVLSASARLASTAVRKSWLQSISGDLPRSDAVQAVEKCAIKLLRTSIATQKAAPESQQTRCIKRGRSAGRFSESSRC